MLTKLHWMNGPWSGKLALSARPRGGDWLKDEVLGWLNSGIATVVSLLTREELEELDLTAEAREVKAFGIKFVSLPIPDRQVPKSESTITGVVEQLDNDLTSGKNVLIHCRQGVGRSGLIAACLLIAKGISSGAAVEAVSSARGTSVPETREQRQWIDHYAATLAGTK